MCHTHHHLLRHLTRWSLCLFAAPLVAQAHLILDSNPGSAASGTNSIAVLGEKAVFTGVDPTGSKLYLSDGTAAGTEVVVVLDDVVPFSAPAELVAVGDKVLFGWGTTSTGTELWATDGTAAGTALVAEINPSTFGSNPNSFAVVDGVAYFSAAASGGNQELWRSDGTGAGTWLVKEIHSSPVTGSTPGAFARLGTTGSFLFAATDATAGRELWISDGTAAGTTLLKDIVPGPGGAASSNPRFLVSFGDLVAFGTTPALSPAGDLWISDGTAAGTVMIAAGISPRQLAVQGDTLFFQGKDTTHGIELWSSDGTAAGTGLLADIVAGSGSGAPFVLTPVGSRWVFFAAFDAFGEELWRTDGTVTELLQDIRTGSASSSPQANGYPGTHLVNSRFAVTPAGKVFFVADDGVHGLEPFVFDTGLLAESTPFGTSCGGLSLTASVPYLGSMVDLTTSGVPAATALSVNLLSLTGYDPPIDVTFLDMPGCYLHCGLDIMTVLLGTGTVVHTFDVVDDPTWFGLEIFSQTFSFVPGINPFGAIGSNGVKLVVGDL
jgi:ELWxxDGT repeat protein